MAGRGFPYSRLRELLKKVSEVLVPGDIRDLPELKDRAVRVWQILKREICLQATPTEEERTGATEQERTGARDPPAPDLEAGNPFL